MGWKFEVYEYTRDITKITNYFYRLEYEGNSFLKALLIMRKLKKDGAGCIKMEWR